MEPRKKQFNAKPAIIVLSITNIMLFIGFIYLGVTLHSINLHQSEFSGNNWLDSMNRYHRLRDALEEYEAIPSLDQCRDRVIEYCEVDGSEQDCREAVGDWCFYRAPDRNQLVP